MPLLKKLPISIILAALVCGLWGTRVHAQPAGGRVFELRTYHCYPGKLEELETRFREHTIGIFKRHGMESIGYWSFQDDPMKANTLIYMLAFPSREQAKADWAAFTSDPEWKRVQAASEANGKLVEKVDSVFLDAVDFSPLK